MGMEDTRGNSGLLHLQVRDKERERETEMVE
jgi:hypothetical protein